MERRLIRNDPVCSFSGGLFFNNEKRGRKLSSDRNAVGDKNNEQHHQRGDESKIGECFSACAPVLAIRE